MPHLVQDRDPICSAIARSTSDRGPSQPPAMPTMPSRKMRMSSGMSAGSSTDRSVSMRPECRPQSSRCLSSSPGSSGISKSLASRRTSRIVRTIVDDQRHLVEQFHEPPPDPRSLVRAVRRIAGGCPRPCPKLPGIRPLRRRNQAMGPILCTTPHYFSGEGPAMDVADRIAQFEHVSFRKTRRAISHTSLGSVRRSRTPSGRRPAYERCIALNMNMSRAY